MLASLAATGFQPGLMTPQRRPSTVAPPAVAMLDPGLVTADMIGRASVFGLCVYTVLSYVDPPSFRRHRRPPVPQPDVEAQQFGWLNADMSLVSPAFRLIKLLVWKTSSLPQNRSRGIADSNSSR